MTATTKRREILWPDLPELEFRADVARRQIEARENRLGILAESDVVTANIRVRLESYEADIARMREHELGEVKKTPPGVRTWVCKCGALGVRPTAYTAMKAHGDHVRIAVWGEDA